MGNDVKQADTRKGNGERNSGTEKKIRENRERGVKEKEREKEREGENK